MPIFRLYEEIRNPGRGRSAALQILELNAAVTSTFIGFKKLRILLAALDLSPPSESGMHQMSQIVCDKIAQLSSDDMNQKLLQASGLEKNIHISVDTRYNTSGIRNFRRTGLQTATLNNISHGKANRQELHCVSIHTKQNCAPKERS